MYFEDAKKWKILLRGKLQFSVGCVYEWPYANNEQTNIHTHTHHRYVKRYISLLSFFFLLFVIFSSFFNVMHFDIWKLNAFLVCCSCGARSATSIGTFYGVIWAICTLSVLNARWKKNYNQFDNQIRSRKTKISNERRKKLVQIVQQLWDINEN